MTSPRVMPDSAVSESQNWSVLEFHFTAAAAGTRHSLIAAQAAATPKVWAMTGSGTADMTAAIAQAICKRPDNKALNTDESNLALGLVTYFTNVPAAADAAFAHAFAIGGTGCSHVMKAELSISPQSSSAINPSLTLVNQSAEVKLNTVTLSTSNELVKDDGTTAIAAGTDTLVVCNGVLFGAIACADVLDTAAASDKLCLRVWVK